MVRKANCRLLYILVHVLGVLGLPFCLISFSPTVSLYGSNLWSLSCPSIHAGMLQLVANLDRGFNVVFRHGNSLLMSALLFLSKLFLSSKRCSFCDYNILSVSGTSICITLSLHSSDSGLQSLAPNLF